MKKLLYLLLVIFTLQGCVSYDYLYTTVPLELRANSGTTSALIYSIPQGSYVRLRSSHKRYRHLIYGSYNGYVFADPAFFSKTKPVPNYNAYSTPSNSTGTYRSSGLDKSPSGGPVQVKGYTRKNGTYVAPYTRRAPTRH